MKRKKFKSKTNNIPFCQNPWEREREMWVKGRIGRRAGNTKQMELSKNTKEKKSMRISKVRKKLELTMDSRQNHDEIIILGLTAATQ